MTPWLGYPETLAYDQGPQFSSSIWKTLLSRHGTTPQPLGVKSHNALDVDKRYHSFLQRIYSKIREDNQELDREHALSLATKVVSDTAGLQRLVPTLLVFGSEPRLSIEPRELPEQNVRIRAMIAARKKMSRIAAQSRLEAALRRNALPTADINIRIGDLELMFREKSIGKWVGPHSVMDIMGKQLTLNTGDLYTSASIDKVKPYQELVIEPLEDNENERFDGESVVREGQLEGTMDKINAQDTTTNDEDNGGDARVPSDFSAVSDGYALMADLDRILGNEQLDERAREYALPIDAFVVKVLNLRDDRDQAEDFKHAKVKEVNGLKGRGLWKKIKRTDRTEDGITIGGRFKLSLKTMGLWRNRLRYVT